MEKGKEMVKAQADLPKKHAAPAAPAKSLEGTIQQVISKAVTSPTDAKIDFAQGVNHITGDPQQKSAGPADAMQSLKAMNMKPQNEKDEDKMEAYEEADKEKEVKKETEDKEKKDMKEVADKEKEMMKASKDKEDMKEGEMPAGLKKYLDKKNDKSEEKEDKKDMKEMSHKEPKKEEKEDEKKDVKEVADKEKEMKKEVADKEKKDIKEVADKDKDMMKAQAEIDKMKKEVADKEKAMKEMMDKKKEMKEVADKEKEMKKETAKDKVKDMDMKEDVDALTSGEDLSEEFKSKAATIFEGAVKAKLVEEIEKLESEYETKVDEKVSEVKEEIVDKVDAYLNYVVVEWMKENELAIEKGLRNEITEDFIGGLKSLFESHYINVPQEKYDVIESQAAEIEKLKEEVNQTIEKNVELNQKVSENNRQEIINDVSSDLAATEAEKLGKLAESIEYVDAADYRGKVETLKASYFPAQKASDNESNEVAATEPTADVDLSESMAAYTAAISKTKAKKLY